ncbi:MAG: radical SAM protein [Bacteroidales bacterium]|jgi:wyosine [tRNA(Phe)-imidazoG37] synthetase (radical SAM superfamily)
MSFLFSEIIFGPVKSRRLGVSLGVNLLPTNAKICTFDCIYCECGYNTTVKDGKLPTRADVKEALETKLQQMQDAGEAPDVITFAGNGEPTMHPEFPQVVDDTIALRNVFFPNAKISVLSNSTFVRKDVVFEALKKVENNIMKLDSGLDATVAQIDRPTQSTYTIAGIIKELQKFEGNLIIQTMFLRGTHNGKKVDNTTKEEVDALIAALKQINPRQIMIYSLDRDTPENTLEKVSVEELNLIAAELRSAGFEVSVAG